MFLFCLSLHRDGEIRKEEEEEKEEEKEEEERLVIKEMFLISIALTLDS